MASRSAAVAPVDDITQSILIMRGQKVLLDSELAALYGVTTKRLNEQVKRNAERFPEDSLFRLRSDEVVALNRSHFATGSQRHRDLRFPPYAFTEHGAIMAATVLNSRRAVEMGNARSASPPIWESMDKSRRLRSLRLTDCVQNLVGADGIEPPTFAV